MSEQMKLIENNTKDIINILTNQKSIIKGKRKLLVYYAIVLARKGIEYVCVLPVFSNLNIGEYIQLRQVVITDGVLEIGPPISGLMLMPNDQGQFDDILPSIRRYNSISKSIGNFELFGKIATLIAF